MDEQSSAVRVREWLREMFGSRLVQRLEYDLLDLRNDYEHRLNDRDDTIADLRSQLVGARAKLETFETILIPLTSPAGNLFKPRRDTATFEALSEPSPGSWPWVQAEWAKKMAEEEEREKNGISEVGEEVQ